MCGVNISVANSILKFTCNSPKIQLVTNGKFCYPEFVGLNPLCCVRDVYRGIEIQFVVSLVSY